MPMKRGNNRLLLIDPPFYRLYKNEHPYVSYCYTNSLAYLAGSVINNTDWDVMIYNADFYSKGGTFPYSFLLGPGFENYLKNLKDLSAPIWREVKSAIEDYKPQVIGISCKSQTFASALGVARIAKEIDEQIIVVVGGPHISLAGRSAVSSLDIDVGVKGEGEETIVALLNAIQSKGQFDTIKGIVYKKNGQICENPPREFIKDLDSLSFPHEIAPLVLKDYDQYPAVAFRNIFAVRGCPYNCFFCASPKLWNRTVRYRSINNIISEIKGLQAKGLDTIRFDDDTFGINRRFAVDLCDALMTNCPGLKWHCEMHVRLVDDAIISHMKRSGCVWIQLGIESGNNDILKMMRKNITIEQALEACRTVRKHGIQLEAFFIIGFPQETEKTLRDTISAMKKVKGKIVYSIFTPYPGTEGFDCCQANGLINEGFDVALYNHQSPANAFCTNIRRERFRMLASQISVLVDELNNPPPTLSYYLGRFRELGLSGTLRKAVKMFNVKG